MRVSGLNSNGDWRFGKGKSLYLRDKEAIHQSIVTRIKSFANDWYLDINSNIDWIFLLSNKNTRNQIISEVERVVLETQGVAKITNLDVIEDRVKRSIIIQLKVLDVFDDVFEDEIDISELL